MNKKKILIIAIIILAIIIVITFIAKRRNDNKSTGIIKKSEIVGYYKLKDLKVENITNDESAKRIELHNAICGLNDIENSNCLSITSNKYNNFLYVDGEKIYYVYNNCKTSQCTNHDVIMLNAKKKVTNIIMNISKTNKIEFAYYLNNSLYYFTSLTTEIEHNNDKYDALLYRVDMGYNFKDFNNVINNGHSEMVINFKDYDSQIIKYDNVKKEVKLVNATEYMNTSNNSSNSVYNNIDFNSVENKTIDNIEEVKKGLEENKTVLTFNNLKDGTDSNSYSLRIERNGNIRFYSLNRVLQGEKQKSVNYIISQVDSPTALYAKDNSSQSDVFEFYVKNSSNIYLIQMPINSANQTGNIYIVE